MGRREQAKEGAMMNTGLCPMPADMMQNRVFDANLAKLRAQFPFLEIQPPPLNVVTVALAANVERTVQLPDNTKMVRFTVAGDIFYVMLQGKAYIPAPDNDTSIPGPLVQPEGWYAVEGIRQISLLSPFTTHVSIHCHVQQ